MNFSIRPVPNYSVRLAQHVTTGIFSWTPMQREGFLKEAPALGSSARTRNLRHAGGRAVWVIVGDYHMTYAADPVTKTITITAAQPCAHKEGECPA